MASKPHEEGTSLFSIQAALERGRSATARFAVWSRLGETRAFVTMPRKYRALLSGQKVTRRLVLVEWEDSQRPLSAWGWLDDYELPDAVTCISVGFLVARNKNAIALAPNLGDTNQARGQACGLICIPNSAVRNIIEL